MVSTSDHSCSGVGDKVEPTMETLPKNNDDDSPLTQKPPSGSEDSVSLDEEGLSVLVAVREVGGNTAAVRRGTKRSFGEVSESETSNINSANKSSKVDSSPSCSNARTNQASSTVKDKIQCTDVSDEAAGVPSESVTNCTVDANDSIAWTDTKDGKTSNKSKPPRSFNDSKDGNSTITNIIRTNTNTNHLINTSGSSASNNNTSNKTSDNSTEDKNNSKVNDIKRFTDTASSDDSSNTRNSRVCNDISNTSAASNSSDTRSMSSTKTAAITIVTSSSSYSRISASSRDTNNTNNNRTSSDTNNNNRNAVNNNSDDSCQSQSSEGGRTPTPAAGRKVYGLRPRSSVRRLWATERHIPEDESSEYPSDSSVPSEPKSAGTKGTHGASTKSKPSGSCKSRGIRTKPLSKYRRITANARERERMAEINTAFAALRAALPTIADYRIASMTKYTTLQLASSYIRDLSKLLDETPSCDSENKKENCPSYLHGALNSSNRRDVNLSVGISELSFERNQQSGSDDKPGDFSVFPNPMNSINNITEEHLEGLGDIENLSDMCWALDFMLD